MAAALALALSPGALIPVLTNPLAAQPGAAQGTGRVTGTILTAEGQPLVGAQVLIEGTRLGNLTGNDGRFVIGGVPAGTYTVRAQRIGFAPRTQSVSVAAGGSVAVELRLTAAATQLTAVSVVGYTTEQRRDITGAVASVRGEELRDQKVATVEEALRGRAPGVQIAASGQPGRPAQVVIRGQNGFGNPSPLYVVDGMYIGQQNPNINPDDIASLEVLKDASAAAQYGSQASNGVIVITTKRGSAGNNQLQLSSFYGVQQVPRTIPMASAAEFQRIYQQAYAAANATRPVNQQIPIPSGVSQPSANNTDWQDALFQAGAIQNYNLTASGGMATANYLLSGSVLDQQGTVMNTGFRRYSARINSDARIGRFTVGEALAVSQARQRDFPNAIFGRVALPLVDVVGLLPTVPVRDPNNVGGYGFGSDANPSYGINPIATLERNSNRRVGNQLLGTAFAEARLFGGLRYRLNLGVNYADSLNTLWTSRTQLRYTTNVEFAELRQSAPNFQGLLYENLLSWDGSFGDGAHRLNAVAGQTSQNNSYQQLTAFRRGFTNETLQQIDAGSTEGFNNNGFNVTFRTNSALSRATYAYRDRYLVTASGRYDCSSRFSAGNRCGTFGAASVGWVASEEGFFKSIPLLGGADFFKLRVSTGVLGDQNIGDYETAVPITQNLNYVVNGPSGATVVTGGATQLRLANQNLRWQRNRSTDFGFDLNLLNNALSITADYFVNDADQLLVNLPLPATLASNQNPAFNAGKVRNAGFELGATHRLDRGAFRLNSTFNVSTTANRVVSLGNGGQPITARDVARTAVGQPIGSFFVKRTAGIFQTPADVQAWTTRLEDGTSRVIQPNAQPGDLRFVDANNDGRITDDDREFVGTPIPKATTGLFLDSRYRAFDFGVNLRGAFGHKIYNGVALGTETVTTLQNVRRGYNPWTPTNTNTDTPRAVFGDAVNGDPVTDRWLERGDFVRIQNIVLGYTLPARLVQRAGISGANAPRIYVNAQNVYTFTGYTGFDPEVFGFGDPLARGVDTGFIYPNPRTITVGFDVRF